MDTIKTKTNGAMHKTQYIINRRLKIAFVTGEIEFDLKDDLAFIIFLLLIYISNDIRS